jgi:hypothetical protein
MAIVQFQVNGLDSNTSSIFNDDVTFDGNIDVNSLSIAGVDFSELISSTAEVYRFRFTAAGGETSESGLDDDGQTLSYLVGKEQVYLNGVLLVRGSDYTASNGTSIASLSSLAAGDILEIISFSPFEVADAISNTIFDAKGDILVGLSADTVGKLTAGSNGLYLKTDSSTATGLVWASVDALPSQTGNTGKYLTTDGTTASWSAIVTDPTPSVFMLMGA